MSSTLPTQRVFFLVLLALAFFGRTDPGLAMSGVQGQDRG